ncbi:ATP-binding protein [Actinoplanes sp. NPDC051859]|uniref:ATP-binding protein n=1 Tax=Actinoplanes sp. NPDC051859 TaxID=3363909 RepID=UPI003793CBEB
MRRRAGAAFLTLVTLFVAVVALQIVVNDRLRVQQAERSVRTEQARDANTAVLQHMTDAETGVRGFQLTGARSFLEPYDQGRASAFTALDLVAARMNDPEVQRLLTEERAAVSQWLYAFATPIVIAGKADPAYSQTARGKELFDEIRRANAAVDGAIVLRMRENADADRDESTIVQLIFAALAVSVLILALALGFWGRRHLLAPIDHIRATLDRLAGGERSARATPAGPAETRAAIGTLNRLAAETERLHAADEARLRRTELRQVVGAELRDSRDAALGGERVARLIVEAVGADAVYGRSSVRSAEVVDVCWPPGAPALPDSAMADVLAAEPGTVMPVTEIDGALAVSFGGDEEHQPGYVCVVHRGRTEWSAEERRLLAALAREIDHSVRQHRLRDRQARLITELRVLDERKDTFVATVTHELRTPLSSILGYAEMLTEGDAGDLAPMQQRGLAAILRNAHRLHDTVSDLLVLDPAQRATAVHSVPVDLSAVAATLAAELAPQAGARDIGLTGETEPVWVEGDARRLERALRCLLDNAIKFSGTGGQVDYRVHASEGRAVVVVTDAGIGIPDGDLPGLFTPFHRAANAMDRAVQGSGLGLAIARSIVAEHGGTITVESKLDQGSTFTITLPRCSPPE